MWWHDSNDFYRSASNADPDQYNVGIIMENTVTRDDAAMSLFALVTNWHSFKQNYCYMTPI